MKSVLSRWFMFGLLVGWALSHATVFGQPGATAPTQKKADAVSAADKIRQALDKSVTFDFVGQSLAEALNHFRDKTGVPINIDHNALAFTGIGIDVPGGGPGQIELKAKNEKAGAVLRRMLNTHRLTFVIFEDALLVTSEEMAVIRQFGQQVSLDVNEVPLKKAIRDLGKNYGVNVVIDPAVAKQADTAVTLQLENASLETSMRVMAELAGIKAVRMGNVMFVTTEEKAKKIRKEEARPFDPMNPALPFSTPPFRGGFGGGGVGMIGGGIAVPARPGIVVPPERDVPPPNVDPAVPPRVRPDTAPPVKKGATQPNLPNFPPDAPPSLEAPTRPAVPAPRQEPNPK